MTALHGWHPGEVEIQRKLGFADAVKDQWPRTANFMPEQHRIFHTSNLPFVPITTLDERGRPWASIVSGSTGTVGFIHSPDARSLSIHARVWDGDPLRDTLQTWLTSKERENASSERFLTAGLGIEFSTRRRNKFAGVIRSVQPVADSEYQIDLAITETLGNCPKYINIRRFAPYPQAQPVVTLQKHHLSPQERLPNEVQNFIRDADTVFMATVYKSTKATSEKYPSHAGMNARSGLPGFIRVRPSDGRTLVVPDYSGNRFVSSLGNIEASKLAGLTLVSFTTGDILYLTGTAANHVGASALEIMARHASITTVKVTGYTLIRDALPLRQQPGTLVERSPYSPKIKYLVEEMESEASGSNGHRAILREAVQLSPDLAVFKFNVNSESETSAIEIRPGQAIVLDFMDWIGPPEYRHMADSAPGSINDDRVRTWTVSSAHEEKQTGCFELTMRKMPGGAVTGALFDTLATRHASRPGFPVQFGGSVSAEIVGITGDFCLGPGKLNVLWIAGGIGVTPFLAMLHALEKRLPAAEGDILFVLATREPEIMLELIQPSFARIPSTVNLKLEIFTSDANFQQIAIKKESPMIKFHRGRVEPAYWRTIPMDKDIFICGPNSFGDAVVDGLQAAGAKPIQIHREGFY